MVSARLKLCWSVLVLFWLPLWVQAQTSQPATRPVPAVQRAVLISIDGLRPDLLARADTPAIHRLMKSGSFTFWARTVPMSITLPSHTSMLTGVAVEKHGIDFNSDPPEGVYPRVPTLLEMAHRAGYTTAMAAGKTKFSLFARPGILDWCYVPLANGGDARVAQEAAGFIREHAPQVLFVHLPDTDAAGHAKGWGSPEQIQAVEGADRAVGVVLAALEEKNLMASTVILLSADHGGAGLSHGPDDPRSRHIPWIISGPGLRKNYDLTRIKPLTVNTEDTCATLCWLLAIPTAQPLDGHPVRAALLSGELLH